MAVLILRACIHSLPDLSVFGVVSQSKSGKQVFPVGLGLLIPVALASLIWPGCTKVDRVG